MEQTVVKSKINEMIDNILAMKDKINSLQWQLDNEKDLLKGLMLNNKIDDFYGEEGTAKIISFSRDNLIKNDVLLTIDKVNKGMQSGKIDPNELMKKSYVCFVLVRGNE